MLLRMKNILLSASTLALLAAACADPVGDAPRAQVSAAPAAGAAAARAPLSKDAVRYTITPDTSKISFVGAKVTAKHDGGFQRFSGTVEQAGDQAKVDVEIDMTSVWTDTPKLTGHLQSPDLFDVAKHPTARFTSTSIKRAADGTATVEGDLTLHGVTKRISFPARVEATADAASAQAEFAINRKDFGIVYPGMPDDLIKDEVLLKLDVRAKRAVGSPS